MPRPLKRPRKLKDNVLSLLDNDPVKAEAKYNALSNDELIEIISSTVYTDFAYNSEKSFHVPEDFDQM